MGYLATRVSLGCRLVKSHRSCLVWRVSGAIVPTACGVREELSAGLRRVPVPNDLVLRAKAAQQDLRSESSRVLGSALDTVLITARAAIDSPRGWGVLRGLPCEDPEKLVVVLSLGLGEMLEPYRQEWSRVIRRIRPSTERVLDGYVLNEFLHTDSTDWREPNDLTVLYCVQPDDRGGGISRLLSAEAILQLESAGICEGTLMVLSWF